MKTTDPYSREVCVLGGGGGGVKGMVVNVSVFSSKCSCS